MAELNVEGPLQGIVSDMTAFLVKGIYLMFNLVYGYPEQRNCNSCTVNQERG